MSKKCKHEFRMKVELFLDIPSQAAHKLNKKALRSREVRIEGANWPRTLVYCQKCGRHG